MELRLGACGIDRLDDRRMGAAEAVAENLDIGDVNAPRQIPQDLPDRRIQIAAVLQEVAGHARAGGRHDESREGRRGHREYMVSGAIERASQDRELRGVAVAAGAGNDDREWGSVLLHREPDAQLAIEPVDRGHGSCPGHRDINFGDRDRLGQRCHVLRRRAEYRRPKTRRVREAGRETAPRLYRRREVGRRFGCAACNGRGARHDGDRASGEKNSHRQDSDITHGGVAIGASLLRSAPGAAPGRQRAAHGIERSPVASEKRTR